MGQLQKVRVLPWDLQDRFNAGRYWERALAGEFSCEREVRDKPRLASSADEPPGTLGYIVAYVDRNGNRVFTVHMYLRPDGSIGGRDAVLGREPRPDPKQLVEEGIDYRMRPPTEAERLAFEARVVARRVAT